MPTPAVALKFRKFRRRFGITAPSVVVRSHVSWQWYVVVGIVAVLLIVTGAWIFVQRSEVGSINSELETLGNWMMSACCCGRLQEPSRILP